ncbi:uncharacterized protein LOC111126447 isoform X2 [Crassostrea virginica]
MIYQVTPFLLLFMVIIHGSTGEQYNLTGSFPAAILGKEFSWECSMAIPPNQNINAVRFFRNSTYVGTVGRFPNGTCVSDSLHPRYDYQCDTDHVFSLIIPADNMTEYENNSMWQCQYYGDGRYRSSNQFLKIAVFIRNISLSPHDDPLTLTEGTSNKITCSVNSDAYPTPVIRWYIGDMEIGGTEGSLELKADKIHDGKILRCLASNNDKCLNKTTFLNILFDQSSSVDVSLGDQLTVRCTVLKSNPGVILGYEWSVLGDNDVIGRESYFTINRVSINDNKTLQCRARNSMGISEPADVRINVLLAPISPRFIKALCFEEHADVVWVTSTPDLIEQKSFVQFSSSSTAKEFSNASTVVNSTLNDIYSVRVTNLFPDATYTFRVVTMNQYGHVTSRDASCYVNKKINEGKKILSFNS